MGWGFGDGGVGKREQVLLAVCWRQVGGRKEKDTNKRDFLMRGILGLGRDLLPGNPMERTG